MFKNISDLVTKSIISLDQPEPNTKINEVRENVNSEYSEELKLNIRCGEDDSHVAVLYCIKCESNLCKICSDRVHSMKTLSNHEVVRLTQKPEPPIYCPLHPMSTAELICKETSCERINNPMCSTCHLYGTHKNHENKLLEQEYNEIHINVANCLKTIEEKRSNCEEYTKDIHECISTYSGRDNVSVKRERDKIEQFYSELKTLALKTYDDFVNTRVGTLESLENQYTSEVENFDNISAELRNIEEMKKKDVIKIGGRVEELVQQAEKNIEKPADLLPFNSYDVKYPDVQSMNIKSEKSSETNDIIPDGQQLIETDPLEKLVFTGPFTDGVTSVLTIKNLTNTSVAFKVKVTRADNCTVRPNSGLLLAGASTTVDVKILNEVPEAEIHRHKFKVQACVVPRGPVGEYESVWKIVDPSKWTYNKLKIVCVEKPDA